MYVAMRHGGEMDLFGKRAISLKDRPKLGRSKREWNIYADYLVGLVSLAGRGNAGLRLHVGGSGQGRYIVRES